MITIIIRMNRIIESNIILPRTLPVVHGPIHSPIEIRNRKATKYGVVILFTSIIIDRGIGVLRLDLIFLIYSNLISPIIYLIVILKLVTLFYLSIHLFLILLILFLLLLLKVL